MSRIKVYRYKAWDVKNDKYKIFPWYATREFIEQVKEREIIEDSEIEVNSEILDDDGKTSENYKPS